MRIERISVFQVDLPLVEGRYSWSGGHAVEVLDSTLVRVDTDTGLSGFGEVCPLGPAYLPAFAEGARSGIAEVGPHLLGADPRQLNVVNALMDANLKGHPHAKSPLDVACWDLLGQAAGLPLSELLGGRYGSSFPLYRAISQDTPERMAEAVTAYRNEGYTSFQLKVGGEAHEDIERIRAVARVVGPGDRLVADANTGWLMHDALRVVRAVRDVDVYIEQPCESYEECLAVRNRTGLPFVLDESIDSLQALLRARDDRAMEVVNLKISKLGGLTRTRQLRDLCLALGIAMTIEDTWGGDFATAAIAHMAHSTPPRFLFTSTDFNSYVTAQTALDPPRRSHGRLAAPAAPGLGVTPDPVALGEPVEVIE